MEQDPSDASASRSGPSHRPVRRNPPVKNRKGSFWTTLPGVLTAVAGLITAVTAAIVGFKPSPASAPGSAQTTWVNNANSACRELSTKIISAGSAIQRSDDTPHLEHLKTSAQQLHTYAGELRLLTSDFRSAIEAAEIPPGKETMVERMLLALEEEVGYVEDSVPALNDLINLVERNEIERAQALAQTLQTLDAKAQEAGRTFNTRASALGAKECANVRYAGVPV